MEKGIKLKQSMMYVPTGLFFSSWELCAKLCGEASPSGFELVDLGASLASPDAQSAE